MRESAAVRWYRGLLRLLPRRIRESHGEEMLRHATAMLHADDHPMPRARWYLTATLDILCHAPVLHWRDRRRASAIRGGTSMNTSYGRDFRFAGRSLRRNPGFALAAIFTLGVGLAAITTIFSVTNGVLLRPLPYRAPDRLVNIWNDFGVGGQSLPAVSIADFVDYKTQTRLFDQFAAGSGGQVIGASGILTGSGAPERVDVSPVTANFFPLLGVTPMLGRQFTADEEVFRGPAVVMLSFDLWQRRFGSDSGIVNRTIELDGVPQRVVGVLPQGFHLLLPAEAFLIKDSQIWKPLQLDYGNLPPRNRTGLTVFARLRPGVTLQQAQAEMDGVAKRFRELYPIHAASQVRIRLVPLQRDVVKGVQPTLLLLLGSTALLVLIACANVANLLLTRASARERELAIRIALGATRGRIVRQLLIESLVVALAGAAIGLLGAYGSLAYLAHVHPANLPRLREVHIDLSVLLFASALCLFTTLLFGLTPALYGAGRGAALALKGGARVAGGGRHLLRRGLIIAEIALSLVLLVAGGLLIRSFLSLQHIRPGFETAGTTTFQVALPAAKYPTVAVQRIFYEQLLNRIRALPGVTAAGGVSQLPLTGSGALSPYAYDAETARQWERVTADGREITSGYFSAFGTHLLAGRDFTDDDTPDHPPVIIIDSTLARRAFPDGQAVGRQLQIAPTGSTQPFATVIGVVEPMRILDLKTDVRSQIYRHFVGRAVLSVAVHGSGDLEQLGRTIRSAMAALDPDLPVNALRPMSDYVVEARASAQFALLLMELTGGIALFLAGIGLYGVISFVVTQRTREFGVRMALGESPSQLMRSVLRQGLALFGPGLLLGCLVAALVTRFLDRMLFHVSRYDPLTFGVVAAFLATVSLAAVWIPARRASRLDPLAALRAD